MSEPLADSPYKGLSYYEETDAPFFFGREQETQVVSAKLMASRLTVLYGQSGVGKSSLLRAGATRHLMTIARENVDRRGTPRLVVAVFPSDEGAARTTWRDDPVPAIASAIERAVASLELNVEPPEPGLALHELLAAWTDRLSSDLLLILDQFEEYLLYHEGENAAGTLAAELPRALAELNLRANVLIAIREDMLASLDTFKARIPTIFDNCVRVDHLERRDAQAAIEKPIATYNEARHPPEPITIEPELVTALLDELEAGRVVVGLAGVGGSQERPRDDTHPVETPYLQLVMTRLWEDEMGAGSTALQLATLDRLGHCERIVKTHLDAKMRTLPRYARYVAARAFHHLVTPSGSKIAHRAADLAAYTGLAEHDIEPVLERLTEPEYRILRRVARTTAGDVPARFEIFHDVLGTPILDWRSRYLRTRVAVQTVRGWLTAVLHIAIGALIVALIAAGVNELLIEVTTLSVVVVVWAALGLPIWVSTTVVLVRRWRRREAWAVPLVGFCAAMIAPVTALVGLGYAGARVARRGRTSRTRPGVDRMQRFASFFLLTAAALMLLGCLVPATAVDEYLGLQYRSTRYSVLGASDRAWLALQPLTSVVLATAVGLLVLVRPRSRRFVLGALSAIALAGAAYFVGLLVWTDALLPRPEPTHPRFEVYALEAGLLGSMGAGLMLVAASPRVVLEIFAAIIGARGTIAEAARLALPTAADVGRPSTHRALVALALMGTAAAFVAAFGEAGAWHVAEQTGPLLDIAFGAWLAAMVPAAAAGGGAVVLAVSRRVSRRLAGWLAGCGLALVTLYAGLAGALQEAAGAGVPLGIAAGLLQMAVGVGAARYLVDKG